MDATNEAISALFTFCRLDSVSNTRVVNSSYGFCPNGVENSPTLNDIPQTELKPGKFFGLLPNRHEDRPPLGHFPRLSGKHTSFGEHSTKELKTGQFWGLFANCHEDRPPLGRIPQTVWKTGLL
jgi:hypothetical protein